MKSLIEKRIVICSNLDEKNNLVYTDEIYDYMRNVRSLSSTVHNWCVRHLEYFNPKYKYSMFSLYVEFRNQRDEFLSKRFKLTIKEVFKNNGLVHGVIMSAIKYTLDFYKPLSMNKELRKKRSNKILLDINKIGFKCDNLPGSVISGDNSHYDIFIIGLGFFKFAKKIEINTYRISKMYITFEKDKYILHVFEDQSIEPPKQSKSYKSDQEEFDEYWDRKIEERDAPPSDEPPEGYGESAEPTDDHDESEETDESDEDYEYEPEESDEPLEGL